MGLLLSIAFIETEAAVEDLFATVGNIFREEVADTLYAPVVLSAGDRRERCGPMAAERFLGPRRAGFVTDAISEYYLYGVRVYPRWRGLFALMDNVVTWEVIGSSRRGLAEAAALLEREPDGVRYTRLPAFMRFLSLLSVRLPAEMVHVMAESQPAGSATGIHFYRAGKFVDNYYVVDLDDIHEHELPQHPAEVKRILKGRFSFCLSRPGALSWRAGDSRTTSAPAATFPIACKDRSEIRSSCAGGAYTTRCGITGRFPMARCIARPGRCRSGCIRNMA